MRYNLRYQLDMAELPIYHAGGEREAPGYGLERRLTRLKATNEAPPAAVFRKLRALCASETLRLTGVPISVEEVEAAESPVVRGVFDALAQIERASQEGEEEPSVALLCEVHRLALPSGDGRFRTMETPPQFARARACPARFVPARMANLVDWLGAESARSMFPAERMALFFARFLEIAPFDHGNFRVSHLALSFFALRAGYPFVSLLLDEASDIRADVEKAMGFETLPLVERLSDALSRSLCAWEEIVPVAPDGG